MSNKLILCWPKVYRMGDHLPRANTTEFTKWAKNKNITKSKPYHWGAKMYMQWEFSDPQDMIMFKFHDQFRVAIMADPCNNNWEKLRNVSNIINQATLKYLGRKPQCPDEHSFQVTARNCIEQVSKHAWHTVGIIHPWDISEHTIRRAIQLSLPIEMDATQYLK